MLIWLISFFLFIPSLVFAQTANPPLGMRDEGGVISRPVFIVDCVGTGISCSQSGITGTLTVSSGSGAPTDADYLVGTSNGSLSAEIVVGTTPGGELGNTWTSPTIDTGTFSARIFPFTSADIANLITDETGTLGLVFNNSPTLTGLTTQTTFTLEQTNGTDIMTGANGGVLVTGAAELTQDFILSQYDCSTLSNGGALTVDSNGRVICTADDSGVGGGDSISIDGSAVTDPNFTSSGDADFINTSNTVIVDLNDNAVDLGPESSGNYVASVATTSPISGGQAGNEGNVITLTLSQNAGTDVTADLEEESHGSEHDGTDGDYVTDSGDTMTGALTVDGSADVIQLTVQGNATQTADIFVIETSGATDILTGATGGVKITGGLEVSGTNNRFTGYDCSGFSNGGVLTTDASGEIRCEADDGGGLATGWTDDGGEVRLDASTDEVEIGSAGTLSAKFAINGDVDETQFLIQGNATQTNDILVIENSVGTDILTGATGGVQISGNLIVDGNANENTLRVQGNSTQTADIFVVEQSNGVDIMTGAIGGIQIAKGLNIISDVDSETALTIELTDADFAGNTFGLKIQSVANDDGQYLPISIFDDSRGTPDEIFSISYNGIVTMRNTFYSFEQTAANGDTAGFGQFWVGDLTPNVPRFTDDAGTDFNIVLDTKAQTLTNKTMDSADNTFSNIALSETLLTAGRSLTISTNDVQADTELYTDTKCIWIENPVAADDLKSIWIADGYAVTITRLWCESDQTVNMMLQVDDGTPTDMDTVDLACISTPDTDTSLDGDASVASGDRVDVDIASVSGSPTWVSFCFTFTRDD